MKLNLIIDRISGTWCCVERTFFIHLLQIFTEQESVQSIPRKLSWNLWTTWGKLKTFSSSMPAENVVLGSFASQNIWHLRRETMSTKRLVTRKFHDRESALKPFLPTSPNHRAVAQIVQCRWCLACGKSHCFQLIYVLLLVCIFEVFRERFVLFSRAFNKIFSWIEWALMLHKTKLIYEKIKIFQEIWSKWKLQVLIGSVFYYGSFLKLGECRFCLVANFDQYF